MFKFSIPKIRDELVYKSAELLYEDFENYFPATKIIPHSSEEMINNGKEEIESAIKEISRNKSYGISNTLSSSNNAQQIETLAAAYTYNRIAARDYAISNCSWSDTLCKHESASQNISYWNTKYYPAYLDNFCHNDCADFVSQALHYGGIPKDSTWTRAFYNNNSWTYAWQNCYGLRSYMLNKGYWKTSNWTNAAAGGVRLWYNVKSSGAKDYFHAGIIVKNDTIIREFNAHTYDRSHYVYSNESNKEYFILW